MLKQNVFNRFNILIYKVTVGVVYSGVFKGMQTRDLPRAPFLGPPSRYSERKYSSFLVKGLLSAHMIFSEPHPDSVLYLQRGPQQQL